MSTGVIYSRISDDPTGKAAGVERQRNECVALAEARGVKIADVIVDNDISATNGKRRPGYERVLELIRSGAVDTVVIWHTDRLYRLPRDLEPIIDLTEGRKLRFLTVTASEIDLNTPSGRMVARMLAAASAQEVEHKAERQRSASDQRAANGAPTLQPGYGYRRVNERDVIEDAEAEVIREASRRVLSGSSLRSIVADFNHRRIATPRKAKAWEVATLRQLLKRPSLAGLRTHRGAIVGEMDPSYHPAIIDRDTHDRLTALFADPSRKTAKGGPTPKHLLSGLAECGRCGETLGGVMKRIPAWTPKPGQTSRPTKAAYACDTCHKVRRLQEPVDELVEGVVITRLERPDAVEMFATDNPAAAGEARDAIAAADARLATAADQFADGVLTGDQLRRITERLRGERERHEKALAAAMPPSLPAELIGDRAREVWSGMHIDTKRSIIRAIMRVVIEPVGSGASFDPESVRIEWLSEAT